jgi:hypothetical protein
VNVVGDFPISRIDDEFFCVSVEALSSPKRAYSRNL